MSPLESSLRELVRQLVREEVTRALADAQTHDEFLSTAAAGEVAGVAPGTVRRWIREGRLEAHGAGRLLRVKRVDLEGLLAAGGRKSRELTPEELAARVFGG